MPVGPRPSPRDLVALALALPWLLWAVLRVFGLEHGHPLTPAVAFTPYVAATAWIPLVVALALRRWAVALVPLAALAALAAVVLPRALPGPQPAVPGGRTLQVMTSNLAYGHADPAAVMALARRYRVDLLSLQELTPQEAARLDAAGARARFPYRVLDAQPGAGGSGLMSRYPFAGADRSNGTRMAMPRARLDVPGAAALDVKAVHPVPPLHRDVAIWRAELRTLPPASVDGPLRMLVGDFNATLDHHELRSLLSSGYVDAADAAGIGLQGTYRQGRRLPPLVAIDHVLVDRRVRVSAASVQPMPGSDHRTLLATVVLPAR
jgi:endonuclease/exonuclease/phosphatase (EEP) superfamily protein YafD